MSVIRLRKLGLHADVPLVANVLVVHFEHYRDLFLSSSKKANCPFVGLP